MIILYFRIGEDYLNFIFLCKPSIYAIFLVFKNVGESDDCMFGKCSSGVVNKMDIIISLLSCKQFYVCDVIQLREFLISLFSWLKHIIDITINNKYHDRANHEVSFYRNIFVFRRKQILAMQIILGSLPR